MTAAVLRCAETAWTELEQHVFSSVDREVGGILVGRIENGQADITTTLPALTATSGSANVTFTHEVWERVHQTIGRDHPAERIVGWYHSHPGFGVFLSEYDTFAHLSFFQDPAMLAVVVDPHTGEAGWFATRDGKPVKVGSRPTAQDPLHPRGVAASTGPTTRRSVAAAAALAAATAAVAGFFIGASTGSRTAATSDAVRPPGTVMPTTAPPAATPPPARTQTSPVAIDYRVRRGDSLWALAESFYGDARLWPRLKAANPQQSDRLDIGDRIRVPLAARVGP